MHIKRMPTIAQHTRAISGRFCPGRQSGTKKTETDDELSQKSKEKNENVRQSICHKKNQKIIRQCKAIKKRKNKEKYGSKMKMNTKEKIGQKRG